MSLKQNRFSIRSFCVFVTLFMCFAVSISQAQVPVNGSSRSTNLAFATGGNNNSEFIRANSAVTATVTKVMPSESAIPFAPTSASSALLDMKGYDADFTRSFTFKNSSSTTYTINSIDFEKQDNLFDFRSIEPGESMPMDVAPGKTFTIRVAFHSMDRNRLATNRLTIVTEQTKEPIMFPIQAIQQPLSDMPWNKKIAAAQAK